MMLFLKYEKIDSKVNALQDQVTAVNTTANTGLTNANSALDLITNNTARLTPSVSPLITSQKFIIPSFFGHGNVLDPSIVSFQYQIGSKLTYHHVLDPSDPDLDETEVVNFITLTRYLFGSGIGTGGGALGAYIPSTGGIGTGNFTFQSGTISVLSDINITGTGTYSNAPTSGDHLVNKTYADGLTGSANSYTDTQISTLNTALSTDISTLSGTVSSNYSDLINKINHSVYQFNRSSQFYYQNDDTTDTTSSISIYRVNKSIGGIGANLLKNTNSNWVEAFTQDAVITFADRNTGAAYYTTSSPGFRIKSMQTVGVMVDAQAKYYARQSFWLDAIPTSSTMSLKVKQITKSGTTSAIKFEMKITRLLDSTTTTIDGTTAADGTPGSFELTSAVGATLLALMNAIGPYLLEITLQATTQNGGIADYAVDELTFTVS